MTWASSKCEIHDMTKMIVKEKEVCPRCELEQQNAAFEQQVQSEIFQTLKMHKQNMLESKSLLQDRTLWSATFESYHVENQEEHLNKQQALQLVDRYRKGHTFNLWFNGKPGVGKSHLSMSILKELNSLEVSCLFVDIDEMLRKIRNSFNDKQSHYTEQYFTDLLTDVDFLVLDDLGAETGNIDTDKSASDFTSRVLRAIVNGRQTKSTIVTTNLSSKKLMNVYDPKLISRLMRGIEVIKFENTKDKRIHNVGF